MVNSDMDIETVRLVEHDPAWAGVFKGESEALRRALPGHIVQIHHVGSTAVPGIRAKPVIDICVESDAYPPTPGVRTALFDMGYDAMGPSDVEGRHLFVKGQPRLFHLHWCPRNGEVVSRQVRFRNVLRQNPKLAREYEALKAEETTNSLVDDSDYANAKSGFVERILQLD